MAYNKYHEGKIYRLLSPSRPDLIYYGSTIRTLQQRFSIHKCDTNKIFDCSSKILIDCGDAIIELVEAYPCESKYELECRERLYIENNPCINKNIPTRTHKEYKELNKDNIKKYNIEYNKQNKEKISIQKKEYRKQNKYIINEKKKEYYNINKEKQLLKRKEYCEQNKDIINQKMKEKYICVCGIMITRNHKARHERTQRHINYISTIDI
jgi:hypothetical protein